jgi:hypothetical protein
MYRIEGADHSGRAFWTAEEPIRIIENFIQKAGTDLYNHSV